MPVGTVSLGALPFSCCCALRREVSPLHIQTMSNRLQVIRIHTCSVTTQVVNLKPIRNLTLDEVVGHSMGQCRALLFVMQRKASIVLMIASSRPHPTVTRFVYLRPKTLL